MFKKIYHSKANRKYTVISTIIIAVSALLVLTSFFLMIKKEIKHNNEKIYFKTFINSDERDYLKETENRSVYIYKIVDKDIYYEISFTYIPELDTNINIVSNTTTNGYQCELISLFINDNLVNESYCFLENNPYEITINGCIINSLDKNRCKFGNTLNRNYGLLDSRRPIYTLNYNNNISSLYKYNEISKEVFYQGKRFINSWSIFFIFSVIIYIASFSQLVLIEGVIIIGTIINIISEKIKRKKE